MEISELKKLKRQEIKGRLKDLTPEYIEVSSREIARRILELDECKNAKTILCYLNYGKEVVTGELIEALFDAGTRVCIPLCTDTDGHIMEAKLYTRETVLVPGAYGIMEPAASEPTVPPEEIDCIITPCVSCDRQCRRLGHGAGYYDRYFGHTDCPKIALCFEAIMSDEIPVDEHDAPVDAVVSEEAVYRQ